MTLTIFTNRSSVYIVFRYSAVFNYLCLLCCFICNRPLPFLSLFTYRLYIPVLRDINIVIVIIIMVFRCPITGFFTPVLLLLKPTLIPTSQATSFRLQYFPYYMWHSQYSCLLYWIYWMFFSTAFVFWSFLALPFIGQTAVVSARKLTAIKLKGIELELF